MVIFLFLSSISGSDATQNGSIASNLESKVGSTQSPKAGWPRGYKVKQRNRAHYLIEEWMLAANQAVARRLFHQVIREKHREILLSAADNSPPTKATLTAALGTSFAVFGRRIENEKRGNKPSSQGTILRRHPAPQPIKMNELV